jgi:hypothetical protein
MPATRSKTRRVPKEKADSERVAKKLVDLVWNHPGPCLKEMDSALSASR